MVGVCVMNIFYSGLLESDRLYATSPPTDLLTYYLSDLLQSDLRQLFIFVLYFRVRLLVKTISGPSAAARTAARGPGAAATSPFIRCETAC